MALQDPTSDTPDVNNPATSDAYSNVTYALDTHSAMAGEPSVFDDVANVAQKAIPLSIAAAANSFINTGASIANWFGAGFDRIGIENEFDKDYVDFYNQHKTGIEVAGLIGGSLIPGLGAIKAASAGVKAAGLLRAGLSTEALTQATGILAPLRASIVENALNTVKSGASISSALTQEKLALIAVGVGEQALQGMVFEAATYATMKASPLLDQDGFNEIAHNMFMGAVTGGVLGGIFEGYTGYRYLSKMSATATKNATNTFGDVSFLGKGSIEGGDRAADIISSLDKIPTPDAADKLGTRTYNQARDVGMLEARKSIQTLVGEGNEDLANAFSDSLFKARDEGTFNSQDALEKLTRLVNIQRVGDLPSVPTSDVFYINRYAPKSKFGLSDLVTSTPQDIRAGGNADLSRAYRLSPTAGEIKIASYADTFEGVPGLEGVPRYQYVKEAFAAGNDIFIDAKNIVHINENSPNFLGRTARPGEDRILTNSEERVYRATGNLPEDSKPLIGAPVYFNVLTGEMTAPRAFNPMTRELTLGITRVIGDLGKPRMSDVGVVAGKKTFLQSADSLITPRSTDLEASSRYWWAAQRGIKSGDVIDTADTAMMEQLYRDSAKESNFQDTLTRWERRDITLNDEAPMPSSREELLEMVKQSKIDLISQTFEDTGGAASHLTSREIAAKANVPESFITNKVAGTAPEDFMVPIENHAQVNTVQLQYKMGNVMLNKDGMIHQGLIDLQYRIQLDKDAALSVATQYFGPITQDLTFRQGASAADTQGAGAKLLSASNANYGTLAQEAERIGRSLTKFLNTKTEQMHSLLSTPITALRQDPIASQEANVFVHIRRRTGEAFTFLPEDIAKAAGVSPNTAVLTKSLMKDKNGNVVGWDQNYTPAGWLSNQARMWEAGNRALTPQLSDALHTSYELSPKVAAFERANQMLTDARNMAQNRFWRAQGLTTELPIGNLYAPPINPNKYPHFALIRDFAGKGGTDGGVNIIVGKTADELESKVAGLKDNYQIIYKKDVQKFHEAMGDYQYSRNFSDSRLNNEMRRQGILNDVYPESNFESTVSDYINFHQDKEMRVARDHVELNNAQVFAELASRAEQHSAIETSKRGFLGNFINRTSDNPFDSYRDTALGISQKDNYPLWFKAQEKTEAFFDTAFRAAKNAFFAAEKNLIPYSEAERINTQMGLPNAYASAIDGLKAFQDTAYTVPPTKILQPFLQKANAILAATHIRLDSYQALIHAISTPAMLLPEMQAAINAGKEFATVEIPNGTGQTVPSMAKLLYRNLSSFVTHDLEYASKMDYLKQLGVIRDHAALTHFDMMKNLAFPVNDSMWAQAQENLSKAAMLGQKLSGSQYAETMSRYVTGGIAHDIFTNAGQSGQILADNIATFVNRVQGNLTAGQRPVAFQGPIGTAMGMFMTYQMNMFQQMFRYVEEGNGKSLALMLGTQGVLFGISGMPGFQMLNKAILGEAAGNSSHSDAYSIIPDWAGNKLGKWLLYGALSNVTNTGLYTRGDTNPRQITLLPLNPLDFPAIAGGINFVSNLANTAAKIARGGDVSASLMIGLEHNSLSRPLSGIAQVAQGFVTDNKGGLVSVTRDPTQGWSDLISAANFSRIAGARPLDDAIAMDSKYRMSVYSALDNTRREALGEAVKTHLYGANASDTTDSVTPEMMQHFASQYARTGGKQQEFAQWMVKQTQEANVSTANKVFRANATPEMQNAQKIMGGIPLPDYANMPSTRASPTGTLASDGSRYAPDPSRPGKYVKIVE